MSILLERSPSYKLNKHNGVYFPNFFERLSRVKEFSSLDLPFEIGFKKQMRLFFLNLLPVIRLSDGKISNNEISISPKLIQYSSLIEFGHGNGKSLVLEGNWDLLEKRFEDLDVFEATKNVIEGRCKWHETVFYQRIIAKIEAGEVLWRCRNKEEFDSRCKYLDNLILSISSDTYLSQKELYSSTNNDEVFISIGRDGDILFSNSAHRLSIAKVINLNEIPVIIIARHAKWVKFKNLFSCIATDHRGILYQPALHPDLQNIPFHHDCIDRFGIIKSSVTSRSGRLLDLGANLGYFCSRFEDEGFDCTAVENSQRIVYCLKKLKRATNKNYKIIDDSILESQDIVSTEYDIVLALNIFHHFIKTKDIFHKFEGFLENLKFKEMYFEPHHYHETQMLNSWKNFQQEEFVDFIKQKTKHHHSKLVGKASDGRPIYKIY